MDGMDSSSGQNPETDSCYVDKLGAARVPLRSCLVCFGETRFNICSEKRLAKLKKPSEKLRSKDILKEFELAKDGLSLRNSAAEPLDFGVEITTAGSPSDTAAESVEKEALLKHDYLAIKFVEEEGKDKEERKVDSDTGSAQASH